MGNQTYFNERTEKTVKKIREIISELPDFVYDFFVAVENNTSPLTRLNYAYDLRIFFNFLNCDGLKTSLKYNSKSLSVKLLVNSSMYPTSQL